jgi:hypothetical protein
MSDTTADAQAYMGQLTAALKDRGLQVAAKLPALTVRNPAVSGSDPQGRALSPGLTQGVLIRNYKGRGLTWCWVWPGMPPAERDAPLPSPEIEPMCPAEQIERAADLINNVVRLRETQLVAGGDDV